MLCSREILNICMQNFLFAFSSEYQSRHMIMIKRAFGIIVN